MTEAGQADLLHERLAALLIGAAASLEVALITHHPIAHAAKGDAPLVAIKAVVHANLAFHTLLMMILVGQLVGLVLFARALGLHRPLVIAGLVLCGLASFMLAVAMTFDGFVTYNLIASCSGSAQGCTGTAVDSLGIVSAIISAFSEIGFGAQCVGFAALSAAMWVPGERGRLAAAAGVVLALAPVPLVLAGGKVDPGRLLEIMTFLAAWGLCVAVVLGRGILVSRSAPMPNS